MKRKDITKKDEKYSIENTTRDLVPSNKSLRSNYSSEEVLNMFEIYTDVVYYAGLSTGCGSDLTDPSLGALETLLEVKKRADTLPPEIRERFPNHFEEIEYAIARCKYVENTIGAVARVLAECYSGKTKP